MQFCEDLTTTKAVVRTTEKWRTSESKEGRQPPHLSATSRFARTTVGLNVAVNQVQLLSARMSVQTITEHHPRCEGRRIMSKCRRRRTPSSLRAPRRIKASSARFHPHRPVPLRGPIDRHRGRARAPVGIAERVLPAHDTGRVKSQGSPSKPPKGCESRPIRR